MGSDIGSKAAGAIDSFAPGELVYHYLNQPLQDQINLTTGTLPAYRAGQAADLLKMGNAVAGAERSYATLDPLHQGYLKTLMDQGTRNTAFDQTQMLGNYLTGLWDKQAKNFVNLGDRKQSLANYRLGYGGRPADGTYQTRTFADQISSNLAPYSAQIIAGLPGGASQLLSADAMRSGNIMNLINQSGQIPQRSLNLWEIPMAARTRNLNDEIAAEQGLGGANRVNFLGGEYQKSTAGRIAAGIGGLADAGVDAYLAYQTGGLSEAMDKQKSKNSTDTASNRPVTGDYFGDYLRYG